MLQLPADLLYSALGLFPPNLLKSVETRDQLLSALQIFRKTILAHEGKKRNDRKLVRYEFAPTPPHLRGPESLLRNLQGSLARGVEEIHINGLLSRRTPEYITTTYRTNRRIHRSAVFCK